MEITNWASVAILFCGGFVFVAQKTRTHSFSPKIQFQVSESRAWSANFLKQKAKTFECDWADSPSILMYDFDPPPVDAHLENALGDGVADQAEHIRKNIRLTEPHYVRPPPSFANAFSCFISVLRQCVPPHPKFSHLFFEKKTDVRKC